MNKINTPILKFNILKLLYSYIIDCETKKKKLDIFFKTYAPLAVKYIEDGSLEVRNEAMKFMGMIINLKKSDPSLEMILSTIPESKMQRIENLTKPVSFNNIPQLKLNQKDFRQKIFSL